MNILLVPLIIAPLIIATMALFGQAIDRARRREAQERQLLSGHTN